MHFTLVRITTPHMPDTRVFDDVLLPMKFALRRLGYKAETRVDSFNPDSVNICLGANYDSEQKWNRLPAGTIIFNLEQLEAAGYPWLKDGSYLKLLAAHEVWDFSRKNIEFLAAKKIKASFLPLGYVPEMTRLKPCPEPQTDVLFYGAITPRRRQVLDALDSRGLNVLRLEKAFGNRRDAALYQTKLLLNIHHSLPASLEIVRLSYALANKRAVVSELNPDTYHYPELAEACAYGPHGQLAELAAELAADDQAREKVAQRGFEVFSALKFDEALAALVGRKVVHGLGADLQRYEERPNRFNIGSGERFLAQAVNVDCRACQQPDLTLTFPDDWSPDQSYPTERFGEVRLSPGSFDCLMLGRALAEAENPELMLSSCHQLLAKGGRLILTLPYSAEEGANQQTGEIGFNENSFKPYIDEGAFELELVEYFWTKRGRMMEARSLELGRRLKSKDAVEAVRIVLRKNGIFKAQADQVPVHGYVQAKDLARIKESAHQSGRCIYAVPAIPWLVETGTDEAGYCPVPPLPSMFKMRSELMKLYFKKIRYRFNLAFGVSGRHDRYREKLAGVEGKIAEIKSLLLL